MKEKKLNLFLLITLIVGTIIGGGIFNSPTDLILKANPILVLTPFGDIGWEQFLVTLLLSRSFLRP